MKRTLADNLVEFLSFSGPGEGIPVLERVSHRDWERALLWLDDTGLAFVLLTNAPGYEFSRSDPLCNLVSSGSKFQGEPWPR
jgi:hypothetical protein